jgi:hypothetical protein
LGVNSRGLALMFLEGTRITLIRVIRVPDQCALCSTREDPRLLVGGPSKPVVRSPG